MPGQMTEIRAQKFDITSAPTDGSQLDEAKKGALQMRVKFVAAVVTAPTSNT